MTEVPWWTSLRMRLVEAYPASEKIRVVLDNLNTHKPASLYETFEPKEARRQTLGFHYTPKQVGSTWQRSSSGLGQASPAPAYCR